LWILTLIFFYDIKEFDLLQFSLRSARIFFRDETMSAASGTSNQPENSTN